MTSRARRPRTVGVLRTRRPFGFWVCLAVLLAIVAGPGQFVLGQGAAKRKKPPPEPVELSGNDLVTGDGVRLSATFYPGTNGKETVPVVLLHMWKGSRKDCIGVAEFWQKEHGHAVLVPDLRGHGGSTGFVGGGDVRRLDAARMSSDHFPQMAYGDLEAVRRFLVQENDEGKLNLSNLCLVGAEMGAAVAVYYAAYDWSRTIREGPTLRPFPDVKALVLISPDWDFRHLPLGKQLNHPVVRSKIPTYVLVGKDDPRSYSDAKRVYSLLSRFHADPSDETAEKDLFIKSFPTRLQGTKMLGVGGLDPPPEKLISRFIELCVIKRDYPWRHRGSRSGSGG